MRRFVHLGAVALALSGVIGSLGAALGPGPVPGLGGGLSGVGGLTASAATTCTTAMGFSRTAGGTLYAITDPTLLGAAKSMTEAGAIGTGWSGYSWTGAGGSGVLYALRSTGDLLWYRYDTTSSQWVKGSGTVIGHGFVPGSKVINIAVGANGWIYVVRADGRLVLYRHTGLLTGAATWADPAGTVIGRGWSGDELIAAQGDGTIFRQIGGNLYWFRHTDPSAGPVTWANGGAPTKIGIGWRFYDLLPLGGGVLLATAAPSGQVSLFQFGDPAGGGPGWLITGLVKYTARPDSYGVTVGPDTCSSSPGSSPSSSPSASPSS